MKNLYPKTTGAFFKLCIVLLIACVAIIYSCKKDNSHSSPPLGQKEQSTFVQEAKSWFERNAAINKEQPLATNATGTNKRKWSDGLKPDWNKTAVYQKDKGTIIEMPLFSSALSFLMNTADGSRATQQNNYTKASYLIQKDSAGVFRGWFMVLVADTTYINGDFSKLNKNSFQSKDPAYSGRLLYFDIQGKFLGGWRYANGEITKTITLSDYTTSNQQVNGSKIKVNLVQTCHTIPITTVTWECITVGDNPATASTTCTAHYTYTTETECNPTGGGGGGSGGGGGGGGSGGGGGNFPNPPNPNCPPVAVSSIDGQRVNLISGGGPCTPTIKNLVNNPCLKKMVDASIAKNVNYSIKESMNSVFNQNTDFNITFIDAPPQSFRAPTVDGDTGIDNFSFKKNPDGTPSHELDFMSVEIRLNTNLSNASKEYITATIMHEALHAYLWYSQTIVNQHLDMARNYITSMSSQLQAMYPNMSASDAKALAWGGLIQEAGSLYSSLSQAEKNNIADTNNAYKNGTNGAPCNP